MPASAGAEISATPERRHAARRPESATSGLPGAEDGDVEALAVPSGGDATDARGGSARPQLGSARVERVQHERRGPPLDLRQAVVDREAVPGGPGGRAQLEAHVARVDPVRPADEV